MANSKTVIPSAQLLLLRIWLCMMADFTFFWSVSAYRQSVSVHECLLTILSESPPFLQFSKTCQKVQNLRFGSEDPQPLPEMQFLYCQPHNGVANPQIVNNTSVVWAPKATWELKFLYIIHHGSSNFCHHPLPEPKISAKVRFGH